MIERFLKNELSKKRWHRFKKRKTSYISLWIFAALIFLSLTAEMWANGKPIVLIYQGSVYFPVYQSYHATEFGQTESLVPNYRKLTKENPEAMAIWPLVKWGPLESNKDVATYPAPPSKVNWLGTDDRGRDVLARLIYGFRYSIGFALLVWIFSYLVGTLLGAMMGFTGGRTDLLGQRVVEIFESVPVLLLLITFVAIFGASLSLLVAFSVAFGWMMISIYMRAEFLKLRKREFVDAAKSLGVSRWRQITKHILPNALGPLVTFSPFTVAGAISSLAVLDYLGLGLPPPTPSWGELLQQAEKNFTIAWWLAVFPSLALFFTLVVLNLIGEGVRDAFDPRKNMDS